MEVKIVFQQVSQWGRADRRRDYVILPAHSPLRLGTFFREKVYGAKARVTLMRSHGKNARGLGESAVRVLWRDNLIVFH